MDDALLEKAAPTRTMPPLGVKSRIRFQRDRIRDLREAIERYRLAGMPVHSDWLLEYYDIMEWLIQANTQQGVADGSPALME